MNRILKRTIVGLLTAIAIGAGASPASAAFTLTFDDVVSGNTVQSIPNGYGGFNWDNFYVIHRDFHPGSGYDNGTVSGDYTAFNGFGSVAAFSATPFTFNSAYLTAAWDNGLNVLVEGLVGSTVVYS